MESSLIKSLFVPFRHLRDGQFREGGQRIDAAKKQIVGAVAAHDLNKATNAWLLDGSSHEAREGIAAATTLSELAAAVMIAKAGAAVADSFTVNSVGAARRLVETEGRAVLQANHPKLKPDGKKAQAIIQQAGGEALAARNPGSTLSNRSKQAFWLGVSGLGALAFAKGHLPLETMELLSTTLRPFAGGLEHEASEGLVKLTGLTAAGEGALMTALREADIAGGRSRKKVLKELGWSADDIKAASASSKPSVKERVQGWWTAKTEGPDAPAGHGGEEDFKPDSFLDL